MLTNREAIDIACYGSQQFNQKAASAGQPVSLDPVMNSHLVAASELIKSAEILEEEDVNNPFGLLLRDAATRVIGGMPMKFAMYTAARGDKKIAEAMYPLGEQIRADMLRGCVEATFQQKQAAAQKKRA